jgi:hypothetical protein
VKLLERVAILLVSLALAIGLIALLTGYFTAHDQASVTRTLRTPTVAP